jgi:hypothetical protein
MGSIVQLRDKLGYAYFHTNRVLESEVAIDHFRRSAVVGWIIYLRNNFRSSAEWDFLASRQKDMHELDINDQLILITPDGGCFHYDRRFESRIFRH